jgi:hypothetical protein
MPSKAARRRESPSQGRQWPLTVIGVTIRWSPSTRPGPWWIEKHKSGPKGNSPWNSLASGGPGAPMYQIGGTITWKILKSQVGCEGVRQWRREVARPSRLVEPNPCTDPSCHVVVMFDLYPCRGRDRKTGGRDTGRTGREYGPSHRRHRCVGAACEALGHADEAVLTHPSELSLARADAARAEVARTRDVLNDALAGIGLGPLLRTSSTIVT